MIQGERIRLRAIEKSDLPDFQRWVNDEEVNAGLMLVMPLSLTDEETWFEKNQQRELYTRPLAVDVRTPSGGWKLIGNTGFLAIDWRVRQAEVGIMIGDKDYWNQGYGGETLHLLLKLGFEQLNLNRIYLHVFDTNPRAIRAYEKIGFVHEGRLRESHYTNGRFYDTLVMSVLRSEWFDKE